MVVFNYSGREINAKIVYYGPGLSGKTTNLERIYGQVPESRRGKMVSMKTRSDRTLFFDFLPVQGGEIKGFRTRYLLYTVPGQVHYNATRKLVLKGTDAIIFVADSDPALREANIESMKNLEENLAEYQLSLDKIPVIIQYNKRDVSNPLSIEELNADLNPRGWPWFEAVAVQDKGVWETFRASVDALFKTLEANLGGDDAKQLKGKKAQPAPASPRSDENLVPPPEEPGSFAPAETPAKTAPAAAAPPAHTPAARPDGGSGTEASLPGDDPVVRLSQNQELWGGGQAAGAPSPPAAPTEHGNLDLSGRGAGDASEISWKEEYVPPGSRPRSGDETPPAAGEDAARPSDPRQPQPARQQPQAPRQAAGSSPAEQPYQVPAGGSGGAPEETHARATAVVHAGAGEGGVIRVPVDLESGRGVIRIEIALQLEVTQAERPEAVDSGATWK